MYVCVCVLYGCVCVRGVSMRGVRMRKHKCVCVCATISEKEKVNITVSLERKSAIGALSCSDYVFHPSLVTAEGGVLVALSSAVLFSCCHPLFRGGEQDKTSHS